MPIEPDQAQMSEIAAAARDDDSPVVMLNLNRYRDRAAYDGGADPELTGREAYARYGEAALEALTRLGGSILWHAEAGQTVIGEAADSYDEVIAVAYPSRAAFIALATDPDVVAALGHRRAGLERATLICCDSEPVSASA
jgi:uncharacterized protein (DUF1330 family)